MRLGCDPEIFLIDKQSGEFKSVIGMLGADKWNPMQIPDLPKGFTLQEDNVALEFGIPPASSSEEFAKSIKTVMKAGLSKLPSTKFSKLSCVAFPAKEVAHPLAKVFGCEPDYNAWTGEKNAKPSTTNPFLRSAGGHVHVETRLDAKSVIRAMDLFLGVPSVLMDKGEERKKLYGSAGAFRPKPYGVEYRTLSNFWIFKPRLIEWVWNNTERALDIIPKMELAGWETDIVACINNNDKELAEDLVYGFDLEVI